MQAGDVGDLGAVDFLEQPFVDPVWLKLSVR
jgi:hypothetical protein